MTLVYVPVDLPDRYRVLFVMADRDDVRMAIVPAGPVRPATWYGAEADPIEDRVMKLELDVAELRRNIKAFQ